MTWRRTVVFFFCLLLTVLCGLSRGADSSQTLSKSGSSGGEVRLIQNRLRNWGYYLGTADGVYGQQTKSAVLAFQRKNGLAADGIAGAATLKAMGLYDAGASRYSRNEFNLLARLISAEAKSEPYAAQVAVGAVVLNRMRHPSFPDTAGGIVYQRGAFASIGDGRFDKPVAESCYRAAQDAMNGWDPSGGAVFFYREGEGGANMDTVMAEIGRLVFFQ